MTAPSFTPQYNLGVLSDLERDTFTVSFSGTSLAFLSAIINSDGVIKATLDQSSVKQNGVYTLDIKVEEKRSDGKTSVKTYTVTFEVTGIKETKNDDAGSSTDIIIDTTKPGKGPDPGKIYN